MGEALSGLCAALLAGWLLLGPAVLVVLSRRVHGIKKVFWLGGSVTPFLIAALGVIVAVRVYPESPLHMHSSHFPAAFFFSVVGVWSVYIAFRRRYVQDLAPNSMPHTDARASAAPNQSSPAARAGGRGR